MTSVNFVRRRWLDFRIGHSVYLAVAIAMANSVMIAWGLEIVPHDFFADSILLFAVALLGGYVPLAALAGVFHRRYQYHIDQDTIFEQSPAMARAFAILIRQTATPEELEDPETKDTLAKLEKAARKT